MNLEDAPRLDTDAGVAMTDSTETVQTHDAVDVEPHGIFLHLGKRRLRLELLLLGS